MDVVAAEGASPPVEALRADFRASFDVVGAALSFAVACAPEGPVLDGLVGPAFVQAIFQAASPVGGVDEFSGLDGEFEDWLLAVGTWTPAAGSPPARPRVEAFNAILASVDDWIGGLFEREHDQLVERLAGGRPVEKSMWLDATGGVVEQAHIRFEKPAAGGDQPGGGTGRRRRWWPRRRRA